MPRDLSLQALTPDALPVNEDRSRAPTRLYSHIYPPHLFTGKPTFPLATKSLWPLSSLARYAIESKPEDCLILYLLQWEGIRQTVLGWEACLKNALSWVRRASSVSVSEPRFFHTSPKVILGFDTHMSTSGKPLVIEMFMWGQDTDLRI